MGHPVIPGVQVRLVGSTDGAVESSINQAVLVTHLEYSSKEHNHSAVLRKGSRAIKLYFVLGTELWFCFHD